MHAEVPKLRVLPHSALQGLVRHRAGNNIMASDGDCKHPTKFQGFALSLGVNTEAEADKYFNALTQGGQVIMPLNKPFWSPRFGMLTDKFGIMWMINVLSESKP
jgi:PhnB protein